MASTTGLPNPVPSFTAEWNATNPRIHGSSDNFGHDIFDNQSIDPTKQFLKYYDFLLHGYNPRASLNETSPYAVLSLFMDAKNLEILCNTPTLDTVISLDFFTKYYKTILSYVIVSRLHRPNFRFRVYFDFFTYQTFNKIAVTNFDMRKLVDWLYWQSPYTHDNEETEKRFLKAFDDANKLAEIVPSTSMQLGDYLFLVLNNAYSRGNAAYFQRFEVILYNLNAYGFAELLVPIAVPPNNECARLGTHIDGGYIGQLVRTFSLRQKKTISNNGNTPSLVLIRDAHRCPSSSDDTHIFDSVARYDWVHNIYYEMSWHNRQNTLHRGPIFYYINARKLQQDPFDACIMPDSHWKYTFYKAFQLSQEFRNDRNAFAMLNGKPTRFGLGYGVDEYCSTYCIYDDISQTVKDTNCGEIVAEFANQSNWIQMFYNWDIFPLPFQKLHEFITKEQVAMYFASVYLHLYYYNRNIWSMDLPIRSVYEMVTSDEYHIVRSLHPFLNYIKSYIPPRNQIHGLVSYSHELSTRTYNEFRINLTGRTDAGFNAIDNGWQVGQNLTISEINQHTYFKTTIEPLILGNGFPTHDMATPIISANTNMKRMARYDFIHDATPIPFVSNVTNVVVRVDPLTMMDLRGGEFPSITVKKLNVNTKTKEKVLTKMQSNTNFEPFKKQMIDDLAKVKKESITFQDATTIMFKSCDGYKVPFDFLMQPNIPEDKRIYESHVATFIQLVLGKCKRIQTPIHKSAPQFFNTEYKVAEIIKYIEEEMKLVASFSDNTSTAGGGSSNNISYITYNKKRYSVRLSTSKTKYIVVKKNKVYLKSIKGQYRYCEKKLI